MFFIFLERISHDARRFLQPSTLEEMRHQTKKQLILNLDSSQMKLLVFKFMHPQENIFCHLFPFQQYRSSESQTTIIPKIWE